MGLKDIECHEGYQQLKNMFKECGEDDNNMVLDD